MPRPPRPPTLESPQTKTRRFDTLLAMLMSIEKDLGDRRLQGRGGSCGTQCELGEGARRIPIIIFFIFFLIK